MVDREGLAVIIRPATLADRQALAQLGLAFIAQTTYQSLLGSATVAGLESLADGIFNLGEMGRIFLAEDEQGPFGMLVIVAIPSPMTGELFAEEICWWVDPAKRNGTAGPRMLREAEHWARVMGLRMIKMVAPCGTSVGRFYEKRGYKALETAYAKVL